MKIVVELPDDVARHTNPGREALEALAVEGYRTAALSAYQAGKLLGLSRLEFDDFLKIHNVGEHAYGVQDLDRDLADLGKLEMRGLSR